MSYRNMSNREGNQQRIMQMHDANMPTTVIAAYMTEWKVPMTSQDVQCIVNTFEAMGQRAVKKSDTELAIKNHQAIGHLVNHSPIYEEDDDSEFSGYYDVELNAS